MERFLGVVGIVVSTALASAQRQAKTRSRRFPRTR